MKKLLILFTMVITLQGCSWIQSLEVTKVAMYAIDGSVLVSSLIKMDDTVTEARASVNANKELFTTSEWAQLEIAGDQIDEIRSTLKDIFGSDTSITKRVMSGVQLKNVVGDVFNVYDRVEEIVLLHAEQFSESQRLQVLAAKHTMDNLKDSYDSIKMRSRNRENGAEPIDATSTIKHAVLAVQKVASVLLK